MPRFEGNDDGYLGWLGDNPDGYVLNVLRTHARHGLMLHRADCFTIQSDSFRGRGWTTNEYVKVCARSKSELIDWASGEVGTRPPRCSKCGPKRTD